MTINPDADGKITVPPTFSDPFEEWAWDDLDRGWCCASDNVAKHFLRVYKDQILKLLGEIEAG